MSKKLKKQKKKTPKSKFLSFIFKLIIFIIILLLTFIAAKKAGFNPGEIDFPTKKDQEHHKERIPSKLKWFNDFKGVENVPDKHQKEKNSDKKFMNF